MAAAAAAALNRNRGVTSVRATKGLFFVFTLLCLVCLASSLIDKDKLDELRQDLQKLKRTAEMKKVENTLDSDFTSKLMHDAVRLIDLVTALLRKTMPDFTPLLELMEDLKPLIESSKAYVYKAIEKEAAEINKFEEKLEILERMITNLEKRAEL